MEKLVETPFIISDLIAPGSGESEVEVYSNTIPIRTWSRGKRLNRRDVQALVSSIITEDDSFEEIMSVEGNLGGYFPDVGVEGVEEDHIDHDLSRDDDNDNISPIKPPISSARGYDDDFDDDDLIEEVMLSKAMSRKNQRQDADEYYEPHSRQKLLEEEVDDDDDAIEEVQEDLVSSIDSPHPVERVNLRSIRTPMTPPPEDIKASHPSPSAITNDLLNMIQEYNEAMKYIDQPSKTSSAKKHISPKKKFVKTPMIASPTESVADNDEGDEYRTHETNINKSIAKNPFDGIEDKESVSPRRSEKQSAISEVYQKKPMKVFGGAKKKKIKTSGYGSDPHKKRQDKFWEERQRVFDAEIKNKEVLAEIALRRKLDEEVLAMVLEKEAIKRKKFKEKLLEKAMKARQKPDEMSASEVIEGPMPGFLAPTKAFEQQVQQLTSKKKDPKVRFLPIICIPLDDLCDLLKAQVLIESEVIREEEEKREKIALMRKKFKEKHRQILENLTKKNKENEKKVCH